MTTLTRRAFAGTAAASVLGANNRINVGIIGTGGRGSAHIADLVKLKDLNVAVTATCDVYRVNREKGVAAVEKGFGAKPRTTSDYRELLGWKDLDAVVIATPDFSHAAILLAALEAGKDAYVEKPFATVFADAKAAFLAARKSGRVVAAGTQHRSEGLYMAAAKKVREGVLGKVTRVEFAVNFQEPRWKRAAERIDPADVDWKNFQAGRIDRPFDPRLLREWQLFSGVTTNGIPGLWMSHYIDLVPYLLGQPYPSGAVSAGSVYLWKDGRTTSDVFYSLLDYPGDFLVSFTMSLTNAAGWRNAWYGTRGTLDCEKWVLSGDGSQMKDKLGAPVALQPEAGNSHMANFLECIRSRQKPRADEQAGFSHAVAGIMSATALATGRRARFDAARLEIV